VPNLTRVTLAGTSLQQIVRINNSSNTLQDSTAVLS